ncbi:hypothetical protein [Flavobacterium mekongense]|uniref:hypothetical protein n=1 Tax=Flavobacterium mekongense TaxID=3379707 RepID=UPI00399B5CFE
MVKTFSSLGIKTKAQAFVGEKIKVKKILNTEIIVHNHKIVDSKFQGRCLHIQIQKGSEKHVVFTSSKYLMDQIEQMKPEDFPVSTKIVEIDDRYEFT